MFRARPNVYQPCRTSASVQSEISLYQLGTISQLHSSFAPNWQKSQLCLISQEDCWLLLYQRMQLQHGGVPLIDHSQLIDMQFRSLHTARRNQIHPKSLQLRAVCVLNV